MNTFSILFQVVFAFVAVGLQQQFVNGQCLGAYNNAYDYGQINGVGAGSASASASASAASSAAANAAAANAAAANAAAANAAAASSAASAANNIGGSYITGPGNAAGLVAGGPIVGTSPVVATGPVAAPVRTSVNTYNAGRGEVLIHRPAPIIVNRPPTKLVVKHPPIVVKPAPVVIHKPPPVVLRKVVVKQYPRPVRVEPVYVNVVKPAAERYFVKERAAVRQNTVAHQVSAPMVGQMPGPVVGQVAGQAVGANVVGVSGVATNGLGYAGPYGYGNVAGLAAPCA